MGTGGGEPTVVLVCRQYAIILMTHTCLSHCFSRNESLLKKLPQTCKRIRITTCKFPFISDHGKSTVTAYAFKKLRWRTSIWNVLSVPIHKISVWENRKTPCCAATELLASLRCIPISNSARWVNRCTSAVASSPQSI